MVGEVPRPPQAVHLVVDEWLFSGDVRPGRVINVPGQPDTWHVVYEMLDTPSPRGLIWDVRAFQPCVCFQEGDETGN